MAKHLDLEEQEQLDQIIHFWALFGIRISWVLIVALGSMAAWNGWNYWQSSQATKAAVLFDEIERAAVANDAERIERALADMKYRFGSTTFAAQGGLLAGKALFDAGKTDGARTALSWVADKASDDAYKAVARLRLVGLDIDAKAFDQALKTLEAPVPKAFESLVADRRGDVFMAQGKIEEAKTQYQNAWRSLSEQAEYRRLVEVKLAALGVSVAALSSGAEVAR
ncbi:MAG: tetratricopeptide repeat protein [Hydrogenophaga sp.]|uniref:YfgM family protein n=1 Tax=Hydrogenophaga sp. TaxID=1904254 RepID=UPI002AB9BFAD|nr:tetratricopeptide repeat protein [Hydrogenophaga sp.]MDZ4189543.1 tetratricopeptide repeat protein [Hydrogenophaga sp.]